MPIVHPPTRRSYVLDSSTANVHALTFEVDWNVLAFDEGRNRESDCPIPYYEKNLRYVRMACHDQKFNHLREYPNQLRLIALRDAVESERMLQCGKVSSKTSHGICHMHRLCPYCAWIKANDLWKRVEELYPRANWSFLTISYDGFLGFEDKDHNDWLLRWSAAGEAIKRLVTIGRIPGAIVREEMSVSSYYPVRKVNPHVHAILSCQKIDDSAKDLLTSFIQGFRDDCGQGVGVAPSIESENIPSKDELRNKVFYINKATDLVLPYRSFFNLNGEEDVAMAGAVNRRCRDFQESYLVGCFNRHQTHYFGDLDKKTRNHLSKQNVWEVHADVAAQTE